MKALRHRPSVGFTLLEVLIALGIVAVLALLSWRGLEEVLRMSTRLVGVDDRLAQEAALFNQLQNDLQSAEYDLSTDNGSVPPVRLTGSGLDISTVRRAEGELSYRQQVTWVWGNGQLTRQVGAVNTNPPRPASSVRSELPIAGLTLRLWNETSGWGEALTLGQGIPVLHTPPTLAGRPNPLMAQTAPAAGTPPEGATGGVTEGRSNRVRLVQVAVVFKGGRSLQRLFELGGVY